MHSKFFFTLIVTALLASLTAAELPPQEFLRQLRQPLTQDAWGEFTGRLTYVQKGKPNLEGDLRVRISFSPEAMYAQLVLNDRNVYGLEQMHATAGKTTQHLDLPENEVKPSIFDFGVQPSDLAFAFIYWDFVSELPRASDRWQECRIMKLREPGGTDTVNVWFECEHGFPMRAEWFHEGERVPWRTLTLKGAKKFQDGLWFVKEMRIDGVNWKTRVQFDFVEKNAIGIQPPAAK